MIRVSDIAEDGSIRYTKVPERAVTARQAECFALRSGDVVVVKSSGSKTRVISGRCALFAEQPGQTFIPSNFTLALRFDEAKAQGDFVWLILQTDAAVKAVHKMTEGSTYPNLKVSEYLKLPIPLPSMPEQWAIAGVLRTVQAAREACERRLAATRQLKHSLLHHLFTYGPVPLHQADQVPLKQTEIGIVPEAWEPVPLGRIAHIGYGVQAAVAHLKDSAKGIPILTNVNITSDGEIDLTTMRYYEVPPAKRDRFILRKGDVLFNWRSGSQEHVGKTALFMLDGEYTHSSFILRMRCSDAIRPPFLATYLHWLRSRGFFARRAATIFGQLRLQ